jgi:N-methylhydantoinase B/oxoprolinase/acetone carboxylase alpha subunit
LLTLTGDDEIAEIVLAGGAGYGDPLTRDYDAIDNDLDQGYVTPSGAARDYGVVVGADGRVDRAASQARRATLGRAAE